jgi:hypothetical protein
LNEFLLTARTRRGRSPYPDFGHQLVICWAVRPDVPERVSCSTARPRSDWRVCGSGWEERGLCSANIGWPRPPEALGMSCRPLCTAVARMTAKLDAFTASSSSNV